MNDDSTTRRRQLPAVDAETERRLAEDRIRRTLPAFIAAAAGRIPAAVEAPAGAGPSVLAPGHEKAAGAVTAGEVPRLEALFAEIEAEIARGRELHPRRYNSHHEAAAVLLEEVFEAWAEVMASDPQALRAELVQVAAVTVRWLQELYRVAPEPGAAAEAPAGDPAPADSRMIPGGLTCGHCLYWEHCRALITTLRRGSRECDWHPVRFVPSTAANARPPAQAAP